MLNLKTDNEGCVYLVVNRKYWCKLDWLTGPSNVFQLKCNSLKTDLGLKVIRSHYKCLLFNGIAVLMWQRMFLCLSLLPF